MLRKEAKLATEAEEKKDEDAEAEAAAAKMLVPRLGGLRSMFGQKNAEGNMAHLQRRGSTKGGAVCTAKAPSGGVRLSQKASLVKNRRPFEPGPRVCTPKPPLDNNQIQASLRQPRLRTILKPRNP